MGLFSRKSEEQKQFEEKQRYRELALERQIVEALEKIYVFPGSKAEFEDFIGYKTAWVDFGGRIKGLIFDGFVEGDPFWHYKPDFQKRIVDSGVVALVNSNYTYSGETHRKKDHFYFGMPVKKE